jgi:hypothetical protein
LNRSPCRRHLLRLWPLFRNGASNMVSLSGAVSVFVYLLLAGLVFGLLWWLVGYLALPEPFNKAARVVLAILAVLVIIGILLSLVGGHPIFRAMAMLVAW